VIYNRLARFGPWSLWFVRCSAPWQVYYASYPNYFRHIGINTPFGCFGLERALSV
jgi:hypothetical protein